MAKALARGQSFAGYLIERLLGVGGMGEVYLARDRDLPRDVALKLLSPAMTDNVEVRARFMREADTAARLAHPNIVAVYARGRDEDRLWMAMQYIEGTDVAAALLAGPLRPDHAVRIIGETAKALDHAHRAGVLHRDVKPANILLAWGPEQRVYLADFGIAKALDQTSQLTRTGEMYASFQYASPEQFELRADMDHRADVYALGCTLFHMLTGELPYPGASTAQLVNGHLNGVIPRPSERNPGLSMAFDQVIARALAKDRDQRYRSCGELAAAAAQALAAPVQPYTAPPQQHIAQAHPGYGPTRIGPTGAGPMPTDRTRTSFEPPRFTGAPTQPGARPSAQSGGHSIPRRDAPHDPARTPGGDNETRFDPADQGAVATVHRPAAPRRRGRGLIIAAILALIVTAGLGIAVGSGALHLYVGGSDTLDTAGGATPKSNDPSQAAAIQAACDYGLLMNTYDYSNSADWQAKVIDGATGTWKTQAQQLLPAISLLVGSDSEHTRGTEGKCVITSGNSTHYELTADMTLVNSTQGKADTTEHQNITMSMDYVDGRWLCSKWVSPLFPA